MRNVDPWFIPTFPQRKASLHEKALMSGPGLDESGVDNKGNAGSCQIPTVMKVDRPS